ncbi:MAG TPA: hypothetical protein VGE73_06460 [Pseudolabrys sp.]
MSDGDFQPAKALDLGLDRGLLLGECLVDFSASVRGGFLGTRRDRLLCLALGCLAAHLGLGLDGSEIAGGLGHLARFFKLLFEVDGLGLKAIVAVLADHRMTGANLGHLADEGRIGLGDRREPHRFEMLADCRQLRVNVSIDIQRRAVILGDAGAIAAHGDKAPPNLDDARRSNCD